MDNHLLLLSGEDIPFPEAQLIIHQPKLKEIAMIGEENFFAGCNLLTISKESLSLEDKNDLEYKSDFEIFMSIMCSKDKILYRNSVFMIFALLFPEYQIKFLDTEILLAKKDHSTRINNINYNIFKDIIISMFELKDSDSAQGNYNPVDKRAEKIAEKLRKHKEKIAQNKDIDKQKVSILSRYVSILTVGLEKDMNSYMNYTVYQLKDEFKRYQKKQAFDSYISEKLAGAQNLEEVDNWMDEIHP